jgi:competence protein ComEC
MFAKGIAFFIGTLVVCALPDLARLEPLLPVLCLALAFLFWSRSLLCALFVAGVLWTWHYGSTALAHGLDPHLNGQRWLVTGQIASVPEVDGQHASFDFDLLDAPAPIANLRKLRLGWYERDLHVRAGERWQVLVQLRHAHGLRNPGAYDFEGRLFDQGIDATGYVVRCPCNARIRAATWRSPVLRAREWIAARIAAALPGSANLGIVQDLAVGFDEHVTTDQWRTFSATGTTHLMAISGFHIAGVAVVAMAIVRVAWRWLGTTAFARRDAESIVGMAAAASYALLAGFSVPTQRTLVTLACVFLAKLLRRAAAVWNLLGVALIGVLLLDPLSGLGAGFWLSFATVAGILYALEGRIGRRSEWRELVPAQAAATLCLLPLTLWLFGSASLVGPLINLVAIPVFSLILVPAILIGVVLLVLPEPCGSVWFSMIDFAMSRAWPVFATLGHAPLAQVHVAARPAWTMLMLGVGGLWVLAPWPFRVRLLGLAFALPALAWRPPLMAPGGFELTVLDVGQGLSVFIATREHRMLFDTGPQSQSGRAAAEFSVIPFLHQRGDARLDALVLSHGDRDHTGGAAAVREAVSVTREWAGGNRPVPAAEPCVAGLQWTWDGVRFEFLHPAAGHPRVKENDASCVLEVTGVRGAALLTGDIEATAENEVLEHVNPGPVDVVVVPHHGSRGSSGIDFVAALAPRWAVVSAGYDNRWHFPKAEVIERWQAAGARVLTTATSGAITFRFEPDGPLPPPLEYRERVRRFWHVD